MNQQAAMMAMAILARALRPPRPTLARGLRAAALEAKRAFQWAVDNAPEEE